MKKVLYIDTETTGIGPQAGLIQLACIIEIDGEFKAERSWNIKPFTGDEISDEALAVNGHTRDEIVKFTIPQIARAQIEEFLGQYVDRYQKNKQASDKFYSAGYNVGFDMEMLAAFWKKCGNVYFGSFFNGKKIDPLPILHFMDWKGLISLPDYKLCTICEFLSIELAGAHDAMADIRATRQVIKYLGERFEVFEEAGRGIGENE